MGKNRIKIQIFLYCTGKPRFSILFLLFHMAKNLYKTTPPRIISKKHYKNFIERFGPRHFVICEYKKKYLTTFNKYLKTFIIYHKTSIMLVNAWISIPGNKIYEYLKTFTKYLKIFYKYAIDLFRYIVCPQKDSGSEIIFATRYAYRAPRNALCSPASCTGYIFFSRN